MGLFAPAETDAPKDTGIDTIINKLKTLVNDLDFSEDEMPVSFFLCGLNLSFM